jgi:AraC-like DNA-binding protein
MWSRPGSVLVVSSRALLEACARLGIDPDEVLRQAGLCREHLEPSDRRLTREQASALWAAAYRVSGDPDLALHAAEATPFGAYRVIDYLALNAASVGEAFERCAHYFPLINTAVRLPIAMLGDRVSFGVIDESGPAGVTRPYAEYCFTAFLLHVREATGVDFRPLLVEFVHQAPASTREHERIFGCPVRFGGEHTRMLFDSAIWRAPTRRAQPGVLDLLTEHAEHLLSKLPPAPELIERARRSIAASLSQREPSMPEIARALGMSSRSLQRHLSKLGYSYARLLDEVRAGSAKEHLGQRDLSIAEVAYLLGFSEQAAFQRAFRRWTGSTPLAYRRRMAS